jgi:hypothetical protein
MYIVRDIFHLKFGHYKDAKTLLDDASRKKLLPEAQHARVLSDFTGDSYRLILEEGFDTLADYEEHLQTSMSGYEWKQWYEQFKLHVDRSYREILKQLM